MTVCGTRLTNVGVRTGEQAGWSLHFEHLGSLPARVGLARLLHSQPSGEGARALRQLGRKQSTNKGENRWNETGASAVQGSR